MAERTETALPGETLLRQQARTADQTHDYVHEQGFLCQACGHRHTGAAFGFICIGCPCAHQALTIAEFDQMRVVMFNTPLETLELSTSPPLRTAKGTH